MCLFFESIQIKNKCILNIDLHNLRLNTTRYKFFNAEDQINLTNIIDLKGLYFDKIYKCRIIYGKCIEEIEFIEYQKRKIESLTVVFSENIDYSYKYFDRSSFDKLKPSAKVEEILIVKNNFITDTSFSNVILKKDNQWFTPKLPLLLGVQREKLLQEKLIKIAEIKISDIADYEEIKLINAMMDFDEAITLPISKVLGI